MAKSKIILHECKICGQIVKNSWGLSDHVIRKHTNERPFKCKSCPKSFSKQYELKRHYVTHTGEKLYKCSLCQESFKFRIHKNEHEDSHGILRHKCEFCDLVFTYRDEKFFHQKNIHTNSDSNFKCSDCYKLFSSEKFLKLHKKEHRPNFKNIQCPTCPLTFTKMREFKVHERSHQGMNMKSVKFSCYKCNESFRYKRDIAKHFREFHPTDKYTVVNKKCSFCDKVFAAKHHLTQHLVSHSNDRKFFCSQCNYKAKRQRDLEIHEINMHSRKGLHQCPYCEKSFPAISMYRSHINKHDNIRSFQCQLCSRAYYSSRSLSNHIKNSHSQKREGIVEKQLCPLCGKLLGAASMSRHLKIHTIIATKMEKPKQDLKKKFSKTLLVNKTVLQDNKIYNGFKCKKCTSKFKKKYELAQHQESCIKKLCTFCETVFLDDLECQEHINRHHKDEFYQRLICTTKFESRHSVSLNLCSVIHKAYRNYCMEQIVDVGHSFECFACGRLCCSETSLNLHIKEHKIWLCPIGP